MSRNHGESTSPRPAGTIWSHFWILTLLAALLYSVSRLGGLGTGSAGLAALAGLPKLLFVVLPIAAGLAGGASRFSSRELGRARTMVWVLPLIMLFLESGVGPPLQRAWAPDLETRTRSVSLEIGEEPVFDRVGSVAAIAQLLSDRGEQRITDRVERLSFDHPRVKVFVTLRRVLTLFLPAIFLGLALGIAGWLNTRIRFNTPVDARFAQLLVAWTVVPVGWQVIDSWVQSARFSVLFEGSTLLTLAVPYAVFGLLSALGWRSAARAARALES